MSFGRIPSESERLDFLTALREGSSVKHAAAASGIPRRTVYYLRQEDPEFAAAWTHAKEEHFQSVLDEAETMLRTRALDPNDSRSYILLIFLLKRLDPKYKENYKEPEKDNTTSNRDIEISPEELAEATKILATLKGEAEDLSPEQFTNDQHDTPPAQLS